MCASKNRAERAEQRAKLKQRQSEEAEMKPKKKRIRRQEGDDTEEDDATQEPARKKDKGKRSRRQEKDTTPGPADPSHGPGQAGPSGEDYNIPTPERTELLTNLKSLLKVDLVSPTFWACCQLSDIETLKNLVYIAKNIPNLVLAHDDHISIIPRLWAQRLGNYSGSVTGKSSTRGPGRSNKTKKNSDGEKWVERRDKAVENCEQRDNRVCVLTKSGDSEIAHIFPYSMLNKSANISHPRYKGQTAFWRLLKVFWDGDRVDKWRNKIFPDPQHPDTGVESCFNLICLAPSAHMIWDKGRFALKPLELSDDEKELTVQFFWQPQYKHKPDDRVDLLREPLSSEGLNLIEIEEKPIFLTYLSEDRSPRTIRSGDTFTLTTDDPGSRPLPSWELLEMQWILQRITAMSGAVGTPELDLNDDDDNNGDIKSCFDRVYKWIPRPPLPGNVPSMAKQTIKVQCEPNQENLKALARDMPRQVVNVS